MKKNICGIQQIGIGLKDARTAWKWYRAVFGLDIKIFEDTATARLMLPYTNGKQYDRYAALAMNMEGGGGIEIWQHTEFIPRPPVFDIRLGDCGIFICKIKCRNIRNAYQEHHSMGLDITGRISKDPSGNLHYYLRDPYNNIFEITDDPCYYMKQKSLTGGVAGAVIGVSDIDESKAVYSDILEYSSIIYDQTGHFDDLAELPGGTGKFRRTLLGHEPRKGPFSRLLGSTSIELIQPLDRKPVKIYQDRIWGELGFIHICFDIKGMALLEKECEEKGFPFTVNSADSFDMGDAAGQFSYISDPDGTPVEFVETHRLPIIKKLGWYMELKDRNPELPLPDWMIKTLKFSRVKD
jgi:catechol 2,3-dioxygenase-like lactoylglutathione lyase family enzyme